MTVKERENKHQLRGALFWLLALLIPLMIAGLGSSVFSTSYQYGHEEIREGWNFSFRSRLYADARLEDFEPVGGIKEGESVLLETVLPKRQIFSPCLTFKTRFSRVRVYEDGEVVYTYGYDIPEGGFVPNTHHYVPLKARFYDHTIRIEITAAKREAFGRLEPVTLGNTEDLMRHYVQVRRVSILIGVFLFFFGAILLVLTPILILRSAGDPSVFFSALIAILMGVYVLCYNEAMAYFTHNDAFSHVMEYISLYFIPPAFILYVLTSGTLRRGRGSLLVIIVADILLASLTLVLHATGVLLIDRLLIFFHALVLMESAYLIWLLVRSDREGRQARMDRVGMSSERVLLAGILLFILCILLEIVRFDVVRFRRTRGTAPIDLITVGALVMVLSIMLNYFFHSIDHLTAERTKERLQDLAFTDALTGTGNRAKCERYLGEISIGDHFAAASIELHGLRTVNEKQGHSVGDLMLYGFGELLRSVFAGYELVGRMEGDEFLVFSRGISASELSADMARLAQRAEEESRRAVTFRYVYSYGVADDKEAEGAYAVRALAEERRDRMKAGHFREVSRA